MPVNKNFKFVFWNAQSISNYFKQQELLQLLLAKNIDVALIAETYLNSSTICLLNGFTVYRNDRSTHGGGVAILVRKGISHTLLNSSSTNALENISINLTINNRDIVITSAYSPRFNSSFENDIRLITPDDKYFMVFGDFNAKHQAWNCLTSNQSGKALFNLQNSSNFVIHNTIDQGLK